MSKKPPGLIRSIAENRRARREYDILESVEAGLVLQGSEVKSMRNGKANLVDAHVRFKNGEAFLVDLHIAPYPQAGPHQNHEPRRPRKLLLKVREIDRLDRKVSEKGLAIVPLKLYFKGPWVKVELALGRGRKTYDKRQVIKERQDKRDTARALRGRD